jgi:alanyl-tRNA synthetase
MIKTREELIRKYVEFFESKGHRRIPSGSLIPENDPTVLFTTAGMHPLVPFLLGQSHPLGERVVNVQKCIRTGDIEEVGDEVHHTFFEMLGNWSFGDYFKKEAIEWSFDFLTSKDWLGISKDRIGFTCFGGDKRVPELPIDDEAARIWLSSGVSKNRIVFLQGGVFESKKNWWGPAGETGPCGPDTEMFYWTGSEKVPEKFNPEDAKWVEIWNDVFMQYEKKRRAILVDGMGCLYDKNFKINRELLNVLQSFNSKKILVVNGYRKEAENLLKNEGYEVFSYDGKINKGNKEFFEGLLEKYSLNPEEVAYLDHSDLNLKTAASAGVKNNLLFDGQIKKVQDFLEKNIGCYMPLKQKNVDTGMGVERTLAVLNGLTDNYLTSSFRPIIEKIEEISERNYKANKKEMRIIADHLRAVVFILGDERAIKPGNIGQGYVLRRLIRRAVRYGKILGMNERFCGRIAEEIIKNYGDYSELNEQKEFILKELEAEEERFNKTLERGLKRFEEIVGASGELISGSDAFLLFQSYGFPIEMTVELAAEKGKNVDEKGFANQLKSHQELSRKQSAGIFKSGLADDSDRTTRLHTATHLLNEALRRVLGNEVKQKGSNINAERARFDFNFSRKLTDEEINKVEDLVNEKISQGLEVERKGMALNDAIKSGAQAEFGAKYPDVVSVYTVVDDSERKGWFSKEICTGPHVSNTKEIGKFKILKEESVAAGVRRIKATVE